MSDLNGWYSLGDVGAKLAALMPSFDPKDYGRAKMVTLIEKSEGFAVRRDNLTVYIRPKAFAAA